MHNWRVRAAADCRLHALIACLYDREFELRLRLAVCTLGILVSCRLFDRSALHTRRQPNRLDGLSLFDREEGLV